MKSMKKAISLLLALVMCLGMLPMSAFAADVPEHEHNQNGWQCVYTEPVTETVCQHTAHDDTCGYAAPTAGSLCTHEHNTDCGYAAAVEGVACTCGAAPDENGVVTHTDDCAYVEAKAEEPCKHQHDETCGYVEAKAEVPCTHVCSEESGCVTLVTEGYWTCTAPAAEPEDLEEDAEEELFLSADMNQSANGSNTANSMMLFAARSSVDNTHTLWIPIGNTFTFEFVPFDSSFYYVGDATAYNSYYADEIDYGRVTSNDTNVVTATRQFANQYTRNNNGSWVNGNLITNWGCKNLNVTVNAVGTGTTTIDVIYHLANTPSTSNQYAWLLCQDVHEQIIVQVYDPAVIPEYQKEIKVGDTEDCLAALTYNGHQVNLNDVLFETGKEPACTAGSDVVDVTTATGLNSWKGTVDGQQVVAFGVEGRQEGTATVETTYAHQQSYVKDYLSNGYRTYEFSFTELQVYVDKWTITVGKADTPTPTAPEAPKREDLFGILGNFVEVKCVSEGTDLPHASMTYCTNTYYSVNGKYESSIGSVYQDSNVYKVDVTLNGDIYAGLYGFEPAYGTGVPHTLKTGEDDTKTITLTWDASKQNANGTTGGWIADKAGWKKGDVLATFEVVCVTPKITDFVKELVESATGLPTDVATALSGTTITYPGTDGKVHIPNGGTVTLLYKITVTGDAGKAYKVTDDKAVYVGGNPMEGTIPTGGTAVIYATKTFSASDINAQGKLVNTATVTPGKGNESSTSSTELTPAEEAAKQIDYTVVYAAYSGEASEVSGLPGQETKTGTAPGSVDFIVSTQVPTRDGYTFAGWAVQGTTKHGNDTLTVTASASASSVTEYLYATWTRNPEKHTVTVKYLCDENNQPFNDTVTYSYTLAKDEPYDHSVDHNCTTYPNVDGFNSTVKSPISFTLSTGSTWAFDEVKTTDALSGTMGDEDITINVWYSRDQKGTIGTDPDGDPTDTPDGIPDKYQVKVTFKVENGAWDNETTGDVVKYLVKYASDGTTYAENGTATLGDIIPAVGSKPDKGYKAGSWDNEPTATTTIGTDTIYTYTYVSDTTADDGKGISITKTRVSIGGDASATVAEPGDVIKWEITVTNLSNVEKTVTLTEGLDGASLSERSFTLAPAGQVGESKTVTATYTVAKADVGSTLVNTVVAKTNNPNEDKTATDEPGTPILGDKVVKMAIKNRFSAQNGDIIPYTVTVQNNSGFSLYGLDIMDDLTTHVYGVDANGTFVRDISTVTLTVVNVKATVGGKEVTLVPDSKNTDANAVNGTTSRKWTVLDRNTPMESGVPVVLTYDVKVAFTAGDYSGIANDGLRVDLKATASYGNWNSPETPATTARLMDTWEAPRYFGLAGMFAYDNQGSSDASSGTPDGTDPGQSGDGDGTNSDSSTATGGGSFTIPGGGGGTEQPEQPDQPVDPNPPVDPVDPDPYEPVIPDEPTPVAPNPPEVEIDDERTPLASANGLNSVDHFAYIIGYDDDTVRPENKITRAEVATIFFRLMTDVYRAANWSTTNDFSDVAAGSWYNNAISTCAKAGLVNGYSDGTFKPDQSITRAEFATIAARFLDEEITGAGAEGFADIEGHWAETNILRAAEAGWVNGDNGRFRPDDYISRAEVMTIVNRMLNRVPDEDHLLPEMKTWSDNPKTAWYYEAVQEATNEHAYEWIDENVENWTELLTIRDWAALEKEWATAYSAGN